MVLDACGFDDQGPDSKDSGQKTAELATFNDWTPYTSEEYPPISCDGSSAFSAVHLTGNNSDNIQAYCSEINAIRQGSYWAPFFSELNVNFSTCNGGYWVTGLSCKGNNCSAISLACTYLAGVNQHNCHWTGFVSEENGGFLSFGAGYYAAGAQCSGNYCDDMSFYVCQP